MRVGGGSGMRTWEGYVLFSNGQRGGLLKRGYQGDMEFTIKMLLFFFSHPPPSPY